MSEPTTPEPQSAEPEPEPVKEPESTDPPRPGRRVDRRMIALGVVSGVAAMAVLALVLMVFAPSIAPVKLGAVADAERARRTSEVEEVARRFVTSLYTFDYRSIDEDVARIRADATGTFSRELEQVLGEVDVFKEAIIEAQGRSSGEVEALDIVELSGRTATARVFVVQTISNKKGPEPRRQFSAVELTLVETPDGWKVDDVRQIDAGDPQPAPASPQ